MLLSVTRQCRYTPVTVMHMSVHKKIMCLLKILNYDIHSARERLDSFSLNHLPTGLLKPTREEDMVLNHMKEKCRV